MHKFEVCEFKHILFWILWCTNIHFVIFVLIDQMVFAWSLLTDLNLLTCFNKKEVHDFVAFVNNVHTSIHTTIFIKYVFLLNLINLYCCSTAGNLYFSFKFFLNVLDKNFGESTNFLYKYNKALTWKTIWTYFKLS